LAFRNLPLGVRRALCELESSTKLALWASEEPGVTVESKPAMAESRRDTLRLMLASRWLRRCLLMNLSAQLFGKGQYAVSKNSTRRASKWFAREYGEVFEESIKFGYFVRLEKRKPGRRSLRRFGGVAFVRLPQRPRRRSEGMHLGELNELEHKRFCSGGVVMSAMNFRSNFYDANGDDSRVASVSDWARSRRLQVAHAIA